MKELAKGFENQFNCLGENKEKYITLTIQIEKKVTIIDKNGEELTNNISYILQFTDREKFMASSLSNLVNNLSGKIHKVKCKYEYDDKKFEI